MILLLHSLITKYTGKNIFKMDTLLDNYLERVWIINYRYSQSCFITPENPSRSSENCVTSFGEKFLRLYYFFLTMPPCYFNIFSLVSWKCSREKGEVITRFFPWISIPSGDNLIMQKKIFFL